MPGLYLAALVFSLVGTALIDYRFKLAFWNNARLATQSTIIGVAFFSTWDYLGIENGIFFKGESKLLVGIDLLPEYPIEELLFLTLLVYWGQLAIAGWMRLSKSAQNEETGSQ